MLRAKVNEENYKIEVYNSNCHYKLPVYDWSNTSEDLLDKKLTEFRQDTIEKNNKKPVSQWPLFDIQYIKLKNKNIVSIYINMLIMDGGSIFVFCEELKNAIEGKSQEVLLESFDEFYKQYDEKKN